MDNDVDQKFADFLSQHFKDTELFLFAGPDTQAYNPMFFSKPCNFNKKYRALKASISVVRITAGLYNTTARNISGLEQVWCLATDFDFDRGDWAGSSRQAQESTLYEFCKILPPTAVTQTRNGFHLYWVLNKPASSFDYPYPASLIKNEIKSDPRSLLPSQCLNMLSRGRKPAHMVDTMVFPEIGASLQVFPFNTPIYDKEALIARLQPDDSPAVRRLKQRLIHKGGFHTESQEEFNNKMRDRTLDIIERIDVLAELRGAGYAAYSRGSGKIICCCMYHDDRHPSAYVDLNPSSMFFGRMNCAACGKTTTVERMLKDMGVEV